MKKTIQKTVLILFLMALSYHIKAQSGQIVGTSTTTGDLYQEENDLGIGSANDPNARVHIFNGISRESMDDHLYYGYRPFLITGEKSKIVMIQPAPGPPYIHPPKPIYGFPATANYFTVDQQGYTGVGILNPFSKLNVHEGVITISAGEINEPTRWEIHGTKSAFAVKDYNLERYRFWINKNDGFVGIGTEAPDAKLHLKDGLLKVENAGGSTTYGSQNSGFSHFTTTLPKFYFNKSIYVNGAVSSYQSDLLLQANGTTGIKVLQNGKVVIGNTTITAGAHTDYKLAVDGKIVSKKVVVTLDNWADNVFDADYKLKTLTEVEQFIAANKHLPEIPSEAAVMENGVELGEINMLLLKKVEELTLYMIEMQKEIDELKTLKK